MKKLLDIYMAFLRIGGLTFGGGYAMLPMLQKEVVEKHKWATEEELMDYYAIGQCTPGVIAINTATFVGFNEAGILGALAGTFGVITPSLIIITVIALFIRNFATYPVVQHALSGITVAVFALVLNAVLKLAKKSIINAGAVLILVVVFIVAMFTEIHSAWLIVGAGIFGALFSAVKVLNTPLKKPEKKKEES